MPSGQPIARAVPARPRPSRSGVQATLPREHRNGQRARNRYDPASEKPYKLSRSKLELFLRCPRCFYLDRRLGIGEPPGPAFTLNSAVDALLKREFDAFRQQGEPHPLMREFRIDAVPFRHPDLEQWRHNFHGVQHLHGPTNLLITGAVDDVWIDREERLIVVDYKATSTAKAISLEGPWKQAYKRQLEVYQWLLRRNGFPVSGTGYFVFANAAADRDAFAGQLAFTVEILPYTGSDNWVEEAVAAAHACLRGPEAPAPAEACAWCAYREAAAEAGNV